MPKSKPEVKVRVVLEGDGFVAEVRIDGQLQATQGRTLREALLNASEVAELMLER